MLSRQLRHFKPQVLSKIFRKNGGDPFLNTAFFKNFSIGYQSKSFFATSKKDPYSVLGVSKSATQDEIKVAYRKLAMKHHPDKGGNADTFKDITAAYDVIGNEEKRRQFDTFGDASDFGPGGAGPGGFGAGGFGGAGGFHDFQDIFGDMFGGGRAQPRQPEPIVREIRVTLEDVYRGSVKKVSYQKKKKCGSCNGKGGSNPKTCKTCNGSGMQIKTVRMGPMVTQTQQICGTCNGEGTTIEHKDLCKTCHGKKTVNESKNLDVNVPRGLPDQHDMVLQREGDEDPKAPNGDVVIRIVVDKHPHFERKGADLYYKKKISLYEALNGTSFTIDFLDGQKIHVTTPQDEVISPGTKKQIKGKGMPFFQKAAGHGNLYIDFDVVFPKKKDIKHPEELKKIIPTNEAPRDFEHAKAQTLQEFDPNSVNTNYGGGKVKSGGGRGRSTRGFDDEDDGQQPQCKQF